LELLFVVVSSLWKIQLLAAAAHDLELTRILGGGGSQQTAAQQLAKPELNKLALSIVVVKNSSSP
jgi:hypothetical protein